tara:strand:+ start:336 stop:461 length:126 start_codon:yes stop_codon:yes gene_type:complete
LDPAQPGNITEKNTKLPANTRDIIFLIDGDGIDIVSLGLDI